VLSGGALQRVALSPIKRLVVADTIDLSHVALPDNIEIVTTAPLFAEAIGRITHEESISELFDSLATPPEESSDYPRRTREMEKVPGRDPGRLAE
jgi:hypothetical protein